MKFYTSQGKGSKLKVRKFWGLVPTFVEVRGEKLVGEPFYSPPPLLILNRVKNRTWPNDDVTRKVFRINKVIWTTKSRVIHVRISIPKQDQIILSSVARVKFIITKVIFRYHTKGVSDQVSSYSDHEIKSYSCSNSSTKKGKNEKVGKILWITNQGKRDNKSGQRDFK